MAFAGVVSELDIAKESRSRQISRRSGRWSESALRVLEERYLMRVNGEIVESPDDMCWRVASAVAGAEETGRPVRQRRV